MESRDRADKIYSQQDNLKRITFQSVWEGPAGDDHERQRVCIDGVPFGYSFGKGCGDDVRGWLASSLSSLEEYGLVLKTPLTSPQEDSLFSLQQLQEEVAGWTARNFSRERIGYTVTSRDPLLGLAEEVGELIEVVQGHRYQAASKMFELSISNPDSPYSNPDIDPDIKDLSLAAFCYLGKALHFILKRSQQVRVPTQEALDKMSKESYYSCLKLFQVLYLICDREGWDLDQLRADIYWEGRSLLDLLPDDYDKDIPLEVVDAVGDIQVYLAHFCNIQNISQGNALVQTWDRVKLRDWTKYPKTGFPEPVDED